ncbi:MAG: TadE/TadG family type IV pilus assembly protein [Devosia sp.]
MIRSSLLNLTALITRFRREERAVAAVEFALIVPFLITLYLGSLEAAALFTVDKRINSISATVGDLVAQWDPDDGKLPTTGSATYDLGDYMAASTGIMAPFSTAGLKIVVSLVQVKADGTTKVLWSKANAAGTARTTGLAYAPLPASANMNVVSRGGCVVAAEVLISYKPLLASVFKTAVNLTHYNFFLPRFGSGKPINLDTTSLGTTACTT